MLHACDGTGVLYKILSDPLSGSNHWQGTSSTMQAHNGTHKPLTTFTSSMPGTCRSRVYREVIIYTFSSA